MPAGGAALLSAHGALSGLYNQQMIAVWRRAAHSNSVQLPAKEEKSGGHRDITQREVVQIPPGLAPIDAGVNSIIEEPSQLSRSRQQRSLAEIQLRCRRESCPGESIAWPGRPGRQDALRPAVPPFRSRRPDLLTCTVGISPEGHDERPGAHPSRLGHATRIFGLASRTKIVEPPCRARLEELMHHRSAEEMRSTWRTSGSGEVV